AAGHVVKEPIECFDIVPTTLALADIPLRHTQFGRSMLPQLRGAAGDYARAVYCEGGYDTHEPHCFEGRTADGICRDVHAIYYPKGRQQQEAPESVCRATMIRTLTHKLVRRTNGEHELYDLVSDPLELANVYGQPACADIQRRLQEQMLDWYLHTSDVVPWDEDPRGFPREILCQWPAREGTS
ncbi:MAG TPA: DUF4976 domain-containing protein, partial [Armatimonadota bacterium]|nr:DUF4976 domain-containing protein [Armatimonadota bacterium]